MDDGSGAELTEPRGGFAGPSGRAAVGPAAAYGSGAPGRRAYARPQSPPCYRNIFADGDSEGEYAAWKAPRPAPAQPLTRFRHVCCRWWQLPSTCLLLLASAAGICGCSPCCCCCLCQHHQPYGRCCYCCMRRSYCCCCCCCFCWLSLPLCLQAGVPGGGPVGAGQLFKGVPRAPPL